MTKQTNGWQLQATKAGHNARINRTKLAAKLKAERVAGSEYTPAELLAIQRSLRAAFYARQNTKETAA